MTWSIKTFVCRNALDGAPVDGDGIGYCRGILGEHSCVSFATTTFVTLWWVIVNTIETFVSAPGARVRRLGTFVNVLIAVAASKAIDAATHGLASLGFYLACGIIHATVCLGETFGTKEILRRMLRFFNRSPESLRPGSSSRCNVGS